MNQNLLETLRQAQRFGFFGSAPIETAAAHAELFVAAIGELASGARIVDLGSGGGLPGLVLADAYPACEVVLVDRRTKRTDFLRLAALRLGYTHVTVVARDTTELIAAIQRRRTAPFDVATARGFGPPEITLRTAVDVLNEGGRAVISEPPAGNRWNPELLTELGVSVSARGSVRVFQRST